jgi:hypothetical protein
MNFTVFGLLSLFDIIVADESAIANHLYHDDACKLPLEFTEKFFREMNRYASFGIERTCHAARNRRLCASSTAVPIP